MSNASNPISSNKIMELLQEQESNQGERIPFFHIDPITKVATILVVIEPDTEKWAITLNSTTMIETLQKHEKKSKKECSVSLHEEENLKSKFPMLKSLWD
jgi:hypothetical protein